MWGKKIHVEKGQRGQYHYAYCGHRIQDIFTAKTPFKPTVNVCLGCLAGLQGEDISRGTCRLELR